MLTATEFQSVTTSACTVAERPISVSKATPTLLAAVTAHHWYSHCLLPLGRTAESLAESKRALELEPLELLVGIHLGWHYLYARQYDEAIEQFRKTLELDPAFPQARRYAAWAYLQKGMHPEAIEALQAALNSRERDREIQGELRYALAVAGRRAEGLAMLEGFGPSLSNPICVTVLGRLSPCRAR